ncbi:hypothetical protein HaLaN_28874, partial [Haematococcus lacustris]
LRSSRGPQRDMDKRRAGVGDRTRAAKQGASGPGRSRRSLATRLDRIADRVIYPVMCDEYIKTAWLSRGVVLITR